MTQPPSPEDLALLAALRAREPNAFDELYSRYRRPLLRYARSVLRSDPELAEDVVQEAFIRAHRAVLRDDRAISLRPWLFRLVRNCALDEISRRRTDSIAIEDLDLAAPAHEEPAVAAERRQRAREVLGDIAALPSQQRHALLRREVDGVSHATLAAELALTPLAARSLVHRARANLVKAEEARSSDCRSVRADLLAAHDERRRASAHAYRHLATCRGCREFRAGLRAERRAMALLVPGWLVFAGAGAVLGGKSLLASGKATATATFAVGSTAVVFGTGVWLEGEASPVSVSSRALPGGALLRGEPVPAGAAVVAEQRPLAAHTTEHPSVTLRCPPGRRVADLLRPVGARITTTYARGTIVGRSRVATVRFDRRALAAPATVTVGILCKRPGARGTIVAGARAAATGDAATVRTPALLRSQPSRTSAAGGSARAGQPVDILKRSGGWARIRTDLGETGWVPARVLRSARP